MIKSFKHRGLERFYREDKKTGIDPQHAKKVRAILSALDVITHPRQLQGFQTHTLRLAREGETAIKVNGNWRVTFRMEGTDVVDVDYLDYH